MTTHSGADGLGAAGLRFERDGPVGWCIIDRPEARNAFTPAMYFGIKKAVHLVNRDPDLRAMIITGTGDVFSAGGDMGGRAGPGDEPVPDIGHDMLPFLTIRDSRAPVVAAVNGICQAGGLLVAMMTDVCVASDRATFRAPELLRGIIDATYAAVLPAHVGIAVARDLLLTARRFDAEDAVRMGLITRVVPHEQLREAALQAVGEILQTGPIARAHVKRMLNDRYGLIDYQTMFASLAESPEPREGMAAFMEKRAPNWVPEQFRTSGPGRGR
jgi:enoyl-CoA hydratase/carnithine racemase